MKANAVKNKADLQDILAENLFISESGYAYDINQIAEFISGEWAFFDYQNAEEIAGTFRDYKNKECTIDNNYEGKHLALNLFSEKDITSLLTHKIIRDAFENSPIYGGLQNYADGVNELTLDLLDRVVSASQILEDSLVSADQNKLTAVLHDPLAELRQHLDKLKKSERKVFLFLTDKKGPISSYSKASGRNCDFLTDIGNLLNGGCGAGFNRHVANLYNALKSYKLYQNALRSKPTNSEKTQHLSPGREESSPLVNSSMWKTKKDDGEEFKQSSSFEPKG
ncbi:hypothetical protein [Legionella maioricensis]|uniref:Uncharacterized protein n=1 Tax=Legionella maioricensis TaxID=2896528 RepID=A0A9X2CYR9_9GAMM|nr:hypothetical protein [Legionella maioricensis]MCL9682920.1 hypothetical protein [Legionella maioricensis]MCL9689109.1 hypothetical protein [Legionella maioricensis]